MFNIPQMMSCAMIMIALVFSAYTAEDTNLLNNEQLINSSIEYVLTGDVASIQKYQDMLPEEFLKKNIDSPKRFSYFICYLDSMLEKAEGKTISPKTTQIILQFLVSQLTTGNMRFVEKNISNEVNKFLRLYAFCQKNLPSEISTVNTNIRFDNYLLRYSQQSIFHWLFDSVSVPFLGLTIVDNKFEHSIKKSSTPKRIYENIITTLPFDVFLQELANRKELPLENKVLVFALLNYYYQQNVYQVKIDNRTTLNNYPNMAHVIVCAKQLNYVDVEFLSLLLLNKSTVEFLILNNDEIFFYRLYLLSEIKSLDRVYNLILELEDQNDECLVRLQKIVQKRKLAFLMKSAIVSACCKKEPKQNAKIVEQWKTFANQDWKDPTLASYDNVHNFKEETGKSFFAALYEKYKDTLSYQERLFWKKSIHVLNENADNSNLNEIYDKILSDSMEMGYSFPDIFSLVLYYNFDLTKFYEK